MPIQKDLNGGSGRALDTLYLKPLGFEREDAWLCDLLPESRMNPGQKKALNREYTQEIIEQHNLKPATIPIFDEHELDSAKRREEILEELELSHADILILLGDQPIQWFLDFYAEERYRRLDNFNSAKSYGDPREIKINAKLYAVTALCHPRQANSLGKSSEKWK